MSAAGGAGIWRDDTPVDPRPGDPVVEILVICTANICRSPLAAAMLASEAERRAGPDAPVRVPSSGLHGLAGEAAAPHSADEARRRGLDLAGHVAQVTDPAGVERADLVLTMTERHRARVARLVPAATRTTFTVREFARLVAALQPVEGDLGLRDRVRFVTRLAHAARAYVARPAGPEDVADPYGGPREGYTRTGDELEELIADLAPQLFGWLPGESR